MTQNEKRESQLCSWKINLNSWLQQSHQVWEPHTSLYWISAGLQTQLSHEVCGSLKRRGERPAELL